MSSGIRKLSLEQARSVARHVALQYATQQRLLGAILDVKPDSLRNERRGKTPVYWVVLFEVRTDDAVFDGPAVYVVNIEKESIELGAPA